MRHVDSQAAEDPDDLRIRQLAVAINHQAGWIGTGKGVATFYAASLAGAVIVVSLPGAALEWNEALLGAARGRLFWSGYLQGAQDAAIAFGQQYTGRVIAATGIGTFLNRYQPGVLTDFIWGVLSRLWAIGAEGPVDVFISETPGPVWREIEVPILWSRDGFTRLLNPATGIVFHRW